MSEPVTALTNFGLALLTAIWSALVFRASAERAGRLYATALAATAVSTLVGGLYHMSPGRAVWRSTALSVGLIGFFLGWSVAVAFLSPRITRLAGAILLVQLGVYAIAVFFSDDFRLVIADYGSLMIAVLIVCLTRWSNAAARWITAAILISFGASALQMSSIRIGPLNHNDIYHLVELVALYCFYRGGMVLSTARSSSQPT